MNKYKNILVYAMVNLGDVVLTTSAISLLKNAFPEAKITMMVKPSVQEAVVNNPVVDDVIVFNYKAKGNSLGKMWAMIGELKRRKFDLAISFDRKLRPALLCYFAGIPRRVGPSKVFDDKPSKVTWLYTDVIDIDHDLVHTLQAETYQTIIRKFTGMTDHCKPVFATISQSAYDKANKLMEGLPATDKKIALCVKGTFELKTWPKDYFSQVVDALGERYNASFFIIGAPSDREYADEVIKAMNYDVKNFCGETSLTDLAALFTKTDLFVTVDTGAAHIAATVGIPMVTMYGCTLPDRWKPINDRVRVFSSYEPCCPCSVRADMCPSNPHPACLWSVKPSKVVEACVDLLEAN
ncbi:MAG: glycosyltransferase family 9 protein [Butyrivibrio sp.]|nr:glycosyltransferase family 9 protein [Butyrivibrio sp.]